LYYGNGGGVKREAEKKKGEGRRGKANIVRG